MSLSGTQYAFIFEVMKEMLWTKYLLNINVIIHNSPCVYIDDMVYVHCVWRIVEIWGY